MWEAFRRLGFSPAEILLPRGIDLAKWSVLACDQFTAQPAYWQAVRETVGDAPSALHMILPEAQLRDPDVDRHIATICDTMRRYLADGLFETFSDALIYVERVQSDGRVRRGLVGKIDLEDYEFTPGNGAKIRATEGTVLSRIPPRVRVREHAPLETPHAMLLADDPEKTVLEPLREKIAGTAPLYEVPLMLGGGSVRGWLLSLEAMASVAEALDRLCSPAAMERKYGLADAPPLLFAVGDGNHSLATAKQCWENQKPSLSPAERENHPARFALVELVNLHDDALQFEPIHRVLFGVDAEAVIEAFRAFTGAVPGRAADGQEGHPAEGQEGHATDGQEGYSSDGQEKHATDGQEGHSVEFVWQGQEAAYFVPHPVQQIAAGTLQTFLDDYTARQHCGIDYIHGDADARELGRQPGNLACLLPPMRKEQLFKTVLFDGVLPRKTFSMGEARDKRYYLECRKIR